MDSKKIDWVYLIFHPDGSFEYDFHKPDVMLLPMRTRYFKVAIGMQHSEVLKFISSKKKNIPGKIHRVERVSE